MMVTVCTFAKQAFWKPMGPLGPWSAHGATLAGADLGHPGVVQHTGASDAQATIGVGPWVRARRASQGVAKLSAPAFPGSGWAAVAWEP